MAFKISRIIFQRVVDDIGIAASRIFGTAPPGHNLKSLRSGLQRIKKWNFVPKLQDIPNAFFWLRSFDKQISTIRKPETMTDLHFAEKYEFRVRKGLSLGKTRKGQGRKAELKKKA